MDNSQIDPSVLATAEVDRLNRRLSRERQARLDAERIAEAGLRSFYLEVALLKEIAVTANGESSVEDVLRFALEHVCEYTRWPIGHAYLCMAEDNRTVAVPTGLWHLPTHPPMESFRSASESTSFPSGIGLPGLVVARAGPVWMSDVMQDQRFLRAPAARECGLRTAFAFPVLAGKDVAAVLEFFSREPAEPDAGLLELMGQVGTQLGRVIERKRHEDKLVHDAFHDPLTRLPNRALFLDRLSHCLRRAAKSPTYKFAVLFVDIDRFKVVNDSLGHLAGDQLIVEVAGRMAGSIRREDSVSRPVDHRSSLPRGGDDTLARLGGDEFTILLDGIRDVSDSVRVAERIQEQLAAPFLICGQQVFTSASIGIALSETGYAAGDDMLRDADIAMYRAKTLGKARSEIFDPAMHASAVRRLKLESDLRRAIESEEFRLHYQPIMSLRHGRLTGFEALLRWERPGAGLVSPAEFLPVMEETGLIVFVGKWVIREACRQMHAWNLQFPMDPPLTVAVNVSAKQFGQPDLVQQIAQALRETGVDPRSLKLELTETVTMRDVQRTAEILGEIKALGVRLSIDDFGTGYSSLSYLRRFPLDTLKVDRSFVSEMNSSKENLEIVQTIIALAHKIGMEVVAEGTETVEQIDQLRSLSCECAQGYFFGKPMDANSILQGVLLPMMKDQCAPK